MKTILFIVFMAIASGLLIFVLINTNYADPLGVDIKSDQFAITQDKPNSDIKLDNIGNFRFKLTEEQLNRLDCSIIGPGTQTYIIIENELYVFECPKEP